MQKKYSVTNGFSKVGNLISVQTKEEVLAIAIMDTGTEKDLEETIMWYSVNFNHGIHVVTTEERFNSMNLNSRFQDVTFITFETNPSLGERANAVADVSVASYFFLTRSDVELVDLNFRQIREMMSCEKHPVALSPLIFNKNKELFPSVRVPKLGKNNSIEVLSYSPSKNVDANLCPFLGIGLYDRALFQRLRGYDTEIESPYFQCLDFGTKCWMYGYPIFSVSDLVIKFVSKQFIIEDRSESAGTDRFYTRALSVKKVHDKLVVRQQFGLNNRLIRQDIKKKAGLYKTDFESLCKSWVDPEV